MTTETILLNAKKAKKTLSALPLAMRQKALSFMSDSLMAEADTILAANELDLEAAKGNLSPAMMDRLTLTKARIKAMADSLIALTELPDPCGRLLEEFTRPNGLRVQKRSVPLGVIGIIYESRPNVTSDAAALCLKSANVAVLRSGKEAYRSSRAIVDALRRGLIACGLDPDYINLIDDTTRESARAMMTANGLIDLLIPRGGRGLISACVREATVPCIETGTGICHIYVEKRADLEMALTVLDNAKTSRPSVCNACEVCLVDRVIAPVFLPLLKERLTLGHTPPVELRTDEEAYAIIGGTPAGEQDFDTEFLDYTLAVKVVADTDEAIAHIAEHSTHHSEAIITEDPSVAERFTALVDSAAVYVNASTRFTDGGEFGLGCEMGISTQKLHARGPMGLCELTTYKYVITGNGQIR